MIEVTVKDNEPFEKALRRFKKKWEKAGVLRAVKNKACYLNQANEENWQKVKKEKDLLYIDSKISISLKK